MARSAFRLGSCLLAAMTLFPGRFVRADGGRADISPRGYLLATQDKLVLPSGRVTPAVFDRRDGKFLFTLPRWPSAVAVGGTYTVLAGERLYNGTGLLTAYDLDKTAKDGWGHAIKAPAAFSWFTARRVVAKDGMAYLATDSEMLAIEETAMGEAAGRIGARGKVRQEKNRDLRIA